MSVLGKRKFAFCTPLLILVICCSAVGAFGKSYYISPTGSDSNSGTSTAPWKTFNKACSMVVAGDTVYINAGTYNQYLSCSKSGTSTARIRWVGNYNQKTFTWYSKIAYTGTNSYVIKNTGNYVDFDGLDITATSNVVQQGIWNFGSHVRIRYNHVHNFPYPANCSSSGVTGINEGGTAGVANEISSNVVHHIGARNSACNKMHGIYLKLNGTRVVNNIIYQNGTYGIHIWHGPQAFTVENNTIFANGTSTTGAGILYGGGDSGYTKPVDNAEISNNILRENLYGVRERCGSTYPNCTGSNNIISGNLCYQNISKCMYLQIHPTLDTGTVNADPKFVNYVATGGGNFHLTSASPAINRGVMSRAPSVDYDNNGRPVGSSVDIGAYEYGSVPVP